MYLNKLAGAPSPIPLVEEHDPLFEATLPDVYDLNTYIPLPAQTPETWLIRLEPLIPSIHGHALAKALMDKNVVDPFYHPLGKPFDNVRDVYKWLESQRRRTEIMIFAIILKSTGQLVGTVGMAFNPFETKGDFCGRHLRVFPEFRRRGILVHAVWLIVGHVLDPLSLGGLGLLRFTWVLAAENKSAAAGARKCGFTYEGVHRNYDVCEPGTGISYAKPTLAPSGRLTFDALVYSMTGDDWLVHGKREQFWRMVMHGAPDEEAQMPARPMETTILTSHL